MKRSTDRILTTHTGSLPRPPDLLAMVLARENGQPYDEKAFSQRVRTAVAEIVQRQVEAGIDIVSDGELGKPGFDMYVKNRLKGFEGRNPEPLVFPERLEFPEWSARDPRSIITARVRPTCNGRLGWTGKAAVEADVDNLRAALKSVKAEEAFIPSVSLGLIAEVMINEYYPTEEAYLYALADVMKEEYQAIASAGLLLQIDAPDVALGRPSQVLDNNLEEFRRVVAPRVEAINHALAGIPEERVRFHVCWGNYEGPHNHDIPLKDLVDLVLKVRAGAYAIESSNPRHAHEWQVWEDVKLPEGKVLIPGVIDSTTNFIEHPELVAQRIVQYARLVGRENVIAGTDCGFGTQAATTRVDPKVMWAKFRAMAEGARIATKRLWG